MPCAPGGEQERLPAVACEALVWSRPGKDWAACSCRDPGGGGLGVVRDVGVDRLHYFLHRFIVSPFHRFTISSFHCHIVDKTVLFRLLSFRPLSCVFLSISLCVI